MWCLSTSKPPFCRWQVPMSMSQHGWLTWEWSCMLTLTRRSWLLFSPCLYSCLSWQVPNGKEEQTEFILPAFNASVVTHQLLWIAVVLPLRSLSDIPVTQTVTFLYSCSIWCVLILCPMESMWARVSCVCYCDIATPAITSVLFNYSHKKSVMFFNLLLWYFCTSSVLHLSCRSSRVFFRSL